MKLWHCLEKGLKKTHDNIGYHAGDFMTKDDQIDKLKRLCRFQFLTLGYYAAPYNYDDKNISYHPLTGTPDSGIKHDGGEQAREANDLIEKLGFTRDELRSWLGPFVE